MSSICPTASQQCRLMALPPELRLKIYEHVWPYGVTSLTVGEELHKRYKEDSEGRRQYDTETEELRYRDSTRTSLLRTCQAIHHEALPAIYDQTTFHFYVVHLHDFSSFETVGKVSSHSVLDNFHDTSPFESVRQVAKPHSILGNARKVKISIAFDNVLLSQMRGRRMVRRAGEMLQSLDNCSRVVDLEVDLCVDQPWQVKHAQAFLRLIESLTCEGVVKMANRGKCEESVKEQYRATLRAINGKDLPLLSEGKITTSKVKTSNDSDAFASINEQAPPN